MDIDKIKKGIKSKHYFTHHAIEKMAERMISEIEIVESVRDGEIIEEYPEDKYGPTCLIYGATKKNRVLHVLVSYSIPLWIITAYEPKDAEWINYKIRRRK
jgi:hypothetical protein